jgi:hypothetical protein
MNLTVSFVGLVGLVVILVAFGVTIHVALASSGLPSYVSPSSNIESLKAEAYDGCLSRLAGKLPEEEAASTCFDHVYENSEDKSDLPSQESSPGSSQNMAPKDDETELSEGEEDNKDSHENRKQTTEDQKDTEDSESDESSQTDEPEDQIMVIEGGKKVAEY